MKNVIKYGSLDSFCAALFLWTPFPFSRNTIIAVAVQKTEKEE
jgi:hypothetical protein